MAKTNEIKLSEHFTYKKLFRFVLPSIIMMICTSVYSVIDGLFISNFVGYTPFAAINVIWPFIMILGGMGFMIGTGGSALVAKTLGEGDTDKANRYFTILIVFTVILGIVLTAVGMTFTRPIARLLGANEELLRKNRYRIRRVFHAAKRISKFSCGCRQTANRTTRYGNRRSYERILRLAFHCRYETRTRRSGRRDGTGTNSRRNRAFNLFLQKKQQPSQAQTSKTRTVAHTEIMRQRIFRTAYDRRLVDCGNYL